ncbi:hypothetical protein GW915_05470 [bacterium]|nr:hypothetical protein [bacterium]
MAIDFQRSLGLELSGPRSAKSVVAAIDRYSKESRWVLSELHVFRENSEKNPDKEIINHISSLIEEDKIQCSGIALNAPLSFPPYLKTISPDQLPFPEDSLDEEVKWMMNIQSKLEAKTPSIKHFIPYLQRPSEIYLRTATPERFPISDAFSANGAALAARARFLNPYIRAQKNEIYIRGSVTRICQSLKMPKFVEAGYSSLTGGLEARNEFFFQIQKSLPKLFIYDEHIEAMTLYLYMFNAFVAALTQQLISLNSTEMPPPNYPKSASWIHLPKITTDWEKLFKNKV